MTGRPVGGKPYYDCPNGHHLAIKADALEEYVNRLCGERDLGHKGLPGGTEVPDPEEIQGPILSSRSGRG